MKGTNTKIGIVIIILGVAFFAWLMNYSYIRYKELPNNFSASRKNMGEKLYDTVVSRDLTNQYPTEPFAVMDLYKDTVLLLYGDIIINDDLLKEVIGIQRQFWSDELLSTTTEQQQFDNLKESLNTLYEKKVRVTKIDVTSTNYDPFNQDICTVNLSEYAINLNRLEWIYYLIKDDDGNWKINTWELLSY